MSPEHVSSLPLLDDVAARLGTDRFGRWRRGFEVIGSTNTEAMRWAMEGAHEGSLVLAEQQTAGRGRHGRTWQAAAGRNLTFSLVLRPPLAPARLGLLTLAASLAVAESVEAVVVPVPVRIKWPNDVLIEGRKCCGMLLESSLAGSTPTVVLGIGLNVNQEHFAPPLDARATSLRLAAGRPVPRAPLLADLLQRLEHHYDRLAHDADAVRHTYQDRLDGLGQPIVLRLSAQHGLVRGRLAGVSRTGALRLDTPDGPRTFHAGDVTTNPA
ncbi:MAG: biotin--[acetyl-CoA-carboxylase] ligase [Rhodothermales bacterium]|nr:biotin--[acetyl-CoA-carboxylase] ligase [Rhodothermales bacterium]